ncbi:MAG: hypothetical protein AB8C84_04230 [Oligoflexales bacterium]
MKKISMLWLLFFFSHKIYGQEHTIHTISFHGLNRTSETWLNNNLPIQPPFFSNSHNFEEIQKHLQNLNIFWHVELIPSDTTLHIHLKEKWTTIPVFRGEFGGGTGLTILGGYDTHVFGQGWTVGGEFRKYGTRPTGGVAYLRVPNLWGQYFSIDFWSTYREQRIHSHKQWVATICSEQQKLRNRILHHITPQVYAGLDWTMIFERPPDMKIIQETNIPPLPTHGGRNFQLLFSAVYDNIHIDRILYEGTRSVARLGVSMQNTTLHPKADIETFYYKKLSLRQSIAGHIFLGMNTGSALSEWYLLGGLDSVRGIPDGALIGQQALYGNFEWRHMIHKWSRIWLQGITFFDVGATEFNHADSIGLGVRIAVPQVHRLMLRIDYAISRQGFSGFSIGLNHFFQAYRPL